MRRPAAHRRLRVLLVAMNYAPERSGTAPYTTAWAEDTARRHQVLVLAGVPHYPEWRVHEGYGAWLTQTVENGVRVRRLRHVVPSSTAPARRLAHESSFAARVLSQRLPAPDVVLAVSPPLFGAAAAARLAARFRVPFGLVVQDLYSQGLRELGHGNGRAGDALTGLESRVVRRADAVLTISDRFRATVTCALGADPARVSVVGNWSHLPQARTDRAAVRAELGWGTEHVVLHAGNMGRKQGLGNVVAAARRADERGLPMRFVLLGDGNQRPTLAAAAAGVRRLDFLPPADQDRYADLLAAADVLLVNELPGVAEMSLPSKLTSYCAAGRPVLGAVARNGATAAELHASGAGVVVPPGAPDALVDGALDIVHDPVGAAVLGERGRAHAAAHNSARPALQQYEHWLTRLAGTTRRQPPRPRTTDQ